MTWLPPWGYESQGPVAHEMGHGFGLPHSSGPYNATYDSRWDVMSDVWGNCPPYDPPTAAWAPKRFPTTRTSWGGFRATGATSRHRGRARRSRSSRSTSSRPGLHDRADPRRRSPPGSTPSRRGGSPATTRAPRACRGHPPRGHHARRSGCAVVDPDANGNPDDAGGMWLPGEAFVDSANGSASSRPQRDVAGLRRDGEQWQQRAGVLYAVHDGDRLGEPSNPAGIACSAGTCSASFPSGTGVMLTPSGGNLTAWGGDCAGTGT